MSVTGSQELVGNIIQFTVFSGALKISLEGLMPSKAIYIEVDNVPGVSSCSMSSLLV